MVFNYNNKPDRLMVVPYRSYLKTKIVIGIFFIMLATFALGFYYGKRITIEDHGDLGKENELLHGRLTGSERQIKALKSDVANLTLSAEVDRNAAEKVRQDVRDLNNTIAELEEAVAFYKGVMDPDKNRRGLSIANFNLERTTEDNRFRYKLVVVQLAGNNKLLKGNLSFTIVGKQAEQAKVLSLHSVSEAISEESIKLRFKYFQEISGDIVLPAGFVPERIEIIANSLGKHAVTIEQKYNWKVQES